MKNTLLLFLALPAFCGQAEDFTIGDTTYYEVRIDRVDATSLTFSHRHGVRTIPTKELPTELQKRFSEAGPMDITPKGESAPAAGNSIPANITQSEMAYVYNYYTTQMTFLDWAKERHPELAGQCDAIRKEAESYFKPYLAKLNSTLKTPKGVVGDASDRWSKFAEATARQHRSKLESSPPANVEEALKQVEGVVKEGSLPEKLRAVLEKIGR